MAVIRISVRGRYIVLLNDSELLAVCKNLSEAMNAAAGYQVSFGWM